ncbi:MAG: DNA-directed DNA polymerase II small subunit [Candidatus Micrarchaeota archaeon]|nr:DNA-directed DNA polymerase II small subunit [Candidatus Micrarchaeota archaeon]
MPGDPVRELVDRLSAASILVSADVTKDDLSGIDTETLAARILEEYLGRDGLKIVSKSDLERMLETLKAEKTPVPAEHIQAQRTGFSAYASEIDADYSIRVSENERSGVNLDGFVSYFRNRMERMRDIIGSQRMGISGMVQNIEALRNCANGRDVTVVGMVSNKIVTKNGNIMIVVDDETGEYKIIFMNGSSQKAKALFEKARRIVNDEVLAVNGRMSSPFIIANEIVWPDIPINNREKTEEDVGIAFISDLHIGSKKFMEKNFTNFIKWLNGEHGDRHDLAGKIKYIVVGGDVVDGIGVYPNQDRDLSILDIYAQYKLFMDMIEGIPDYIHMFIIPGNHDAIQRAEPQPALTKELVGEIKRDNVHMLPNPSFLTLHGVDVLAYHGTSLDSIIRSIPGLSYADPEGAMVELLKRRHLSPIYGGNIIVPSPKDSMVIDKVPDILTMGHVHKNCLGNYHGVDILNSGTWQARTDFQIVQGHVPSPCILSVYEARYNRFATLNFA